MLRALSFLLLSVQALGLSCTETRLMQLSSNRIGAYVAQCTDSGAWQPKQCHGSTGYCWCVDHEGKRQGSTVSPASMIYLECEGQDV